MEAGTIVRLIPANKRGIVLNTDEEMAHLLFYDFTTAWVLVNDLEKLGHSDAIYKAMYEMMR